MSWLLRIRNALRPNRLDRELEEELRHHLAMRAADQERAGMDAEAAQAQAEWMLGNTLRLKERMRDMDLSEWLDTVLRDVRYAGRQMRRSPGFTTVAVLSLALGIGANTGIFSLLNTVLMKSLPVKDPGSLVILSDPESSGVAVGSSTGDRGLLTYREFEQLRDRMDVFEGMFATESGMSRYDARINGGGSSLAATGAPPDSPGWPLTFTHPKDPGRELAAVALASGGVSGSGLGKGPHIVDPRTGTPVAHTIAAWVTAPTAAEADALSTAFMVMTPDEVERYCARTPDTRALLVAGQVAGGAVRRFGQW